MGQPQINHFAFGDIINFENINIEGLAEKIQAKPEAQRTKFEREFLRIYNKAEKTGTEFCIQQIKDKARNFARDNWLLLAIAALIITALIFRKK